MTQSSWIARWRDCVANISQAIAGVPLSTDECRAFLNETTVPTPLNSSPAPLGNANVFRYPPDNPKINIRLNSIHAVKGETHTATLVMESFYHAYHLKKLKGWLLGKKCGGASENSNMQQRLSSTTLR